MTTFFGLAALAGFPAIAGVLLGTGAINPYWAALAFGVGAGAILQVIIEVAAFMTRQGGSGRLLEPTRAPVSSPVSSSCTRPRCSFELGSDRPCQSATPQSLIA